MAFAFASPLDNCRTLMLMLAGPCPAQVVAAGGHRVSIGVTTGHLLCTCVGARKLRSEYTVFGDAINLSARLMCKAKKDPSVGDVSSARAALYCMLHAAVGGCVTCVHSSGPLGGPGPSE